MITLLFILIASFIAAILNGNKNLYSLYGGSRVVNMFSSDLFVSLSALKIAAICAAIVCYNPITTPFVDFFLYAGVWVYNYTFFSALFCRRK